MNKVCVCVCGQNEKQEGNSRSNGSMCQVGGRRENERQLSSFACESLVQDKIYDFSSRLFPSRDCNRL